MKKLLLTCVLLFVAVVGNAQFTEFPVVEITEEKALEMVKTLFAGKDVDYYIGDALDGNLNLIENDVVVDTKRVMNN